MFINIVFFLLGSDRPLGHLSYFSSTLFEGYRSTLFGKHCRDSPDCLLVKGDEITYDRSYGDRLDKNLF